MFCYSNNFTKNIRRNKTPIIEANMIAATLLTKNKPNTTISPIAIIGHHNIKVVNNAKRNIPIIAKNCPIALRSLFIFLLYIFFLKFSKYDNIYNK